MNKRHRGRKGSAITEFGPALFFLFVLVFFPLIDVLYLACGYGFAWYLHSYEIRELSVRPPVAGNATTVLGQVDDDFLKSSPGLAKFLGIESSNKATTITHAAPVYTPEAAGVRGEVRLTTNILVKPFLYIPFFPNVPGVSASMPFTFTSSKPQEENGQDG